VRGARSGAVLGGATVAGLLIAAWWGRRRAAATGAAVSGLSRIERNVAVARTATRAGSALAVHRVRRSVASPERRDELDEQFQLRTAEQVTEALGNMKGALMKIGQMVSYLDEGLPEPFRVALSQLQQNAPPMSSDLASEVIERELGSAPERVFASWDPVPIAAASIGQVHRAMTDDGVEVAVKVQYPGVDAAIRADLDNAGLLFAGMGMMFPGLEPGPIVEEVRARLSEELDYLREADNQRAFARFYEGHPFIHVPRVVDRYCTQRVFTNELADGVRFDELSTWSQHERDLAAETIYRFVFRSLYRFHAFNGDPHPGNYLFQPGGRVTFLDFGLVKYFTPYEVDIFERLARTMAVERDASAFRQVIEDAGFLPPGTSFTNDEIEDYFGHFYAQVREQGVTTYDGAYASETARRLFDVAGPHGELIKAANVPPSYVLIQRINLGLFAILGKLHATGNWRAIAEEIWPFVDGQPATSLGREEAGWWSARP
jgi:predicted unusual protein kinase regulating ubiquinone biosynthesis (AarF/ABC1/UbiB family)